MWIPLEEALKDYWKSTYLAAYQICRNSQDAEDAAEDAFVRYYDSNIDFDSREHIRAWLIRASLNRARDFQRTPWNRKRSITEAAEDGTADLPEYADRLAPSAEEELLRQERSAALTQAVAELPARCRIVIHFYYYENASCEEIAEVLGISNAAVRQRLSRARKILKNKLKEVISDD